MIILDHIYGLGVVILENLINESEVKYFLYRIEKNFPNFVAGVITDRHGFPLLHHLIHQIDLI